MRHTIEELRGYLLQIEPHENYRSFVDGWNRLSAALDELESLRPLLARVKELEDDLSETAWLLTKAEAESEARMRDRGSGRWPMSHTPGPWYWRDGYLCNANGDVLAESRGALGGDMKMMLAAPEMLALLRDTTSALEGSRNGSRSDIARDARALLNRLEGV